MLVDAAFVGILLVNVIVVDILIHLPNNTIVLIIIIQCDDDL